MTNLSADEIWNKLPYAKGLQYYTVFFEMRGIRCKSVTAEESAPSLME